MPATPDISDTPDNPAMSLLIPLLPLTQEPQNQAAGPNDQTGGGTAPGTTQEQAPGGAGGAQGPDPGCGTETFVMMGLFLALMWFMVLRPESKRRKETQSMLSLLKQGDLVVTTGGIHGTVSNLTDKLVTLQVDSIQMVLDRSAIARVVRDEPAALGDGSS